MCIGCCWAWEQAESGEGWTLETSFLSNCSFGEIQVKPRGILPTYVTDSQVILCKAAPKIRNAYEIRLALFMAVQSGRQFVLAVKPTATIEKALESHIRQHGGDVIRDAIDSHSVYVGAVGRDGEEGEGWVAGNNELWASVLSDVGSTWVRERLSVGGSISTGELTRFREALETEVIRGCNVDDEDIQQALLRLAAEAIQSGGSLFVQ